MFYTCKKSTTVYTLNKSCSAACVLGFFKNFVQKDCQKNLILKQKVKL